MDEEVKRWQKNLEILSIYTKYYMLRIAQVSKEIIDDPETPDSIREAGKKYYAVTIMSLGDTYVNPFFNLNYLNLNKDNKEKQRRN